MDDFRQAVKDIINGVEHLATLQRATEVSPFITETTIGPNIIRTTLNKESNNKSENMEIEKAQQAEQQASMENADKTNTVNETILLPSEPLSQHVDMMDGVESTFDNHVDLKTVRCFVLRRQMEEHTKREVYKGLCAIKQRHDKVMYEKLVIIQQESEKEKIEWLAKRRSNEARIMQLAAKQSKKEMEELNRKLEAMRKSGQHEIQQLAVQAILQYQTKFNKKYKEIGNILLSLDKQATSFCVQFNCKLREQIEMFEQLINKIKNDICGINEIEMAEDLCFSLSALEYNILEVCGQLEQNEQNGVNVMLKQKYQQENQEKQQQQTIIKRDASKLQEQQHSITAPSVQPLQPVKVSTTKPLQSLSTATIINPAIEFPSNCVSLERLEFYVKINQFYMEKVDKVKVLQTDDSMKEYRLECQKSINTPVNAISGASQQHLKDKYDKLCTFLLSQNDLGRDFCVMLMSKKFVSQGETTISGNPHAVFPIASMIVTLWKQIPEFGQMFLANIFKKSPFMVPYFIGQRPGQSIEEYARILGYRIINGQLEEQHMYLKRQAGIARLYAAIMITKGRQDHDGHPTFYQHPYGLENAWRWFANIIQLTPLPDICATVIMEFLNILGHDIWKIYGKQFTKLLIYIRKYYFPKLAKVDNGGPKVRFEILLNNLLKEEKIAKPECMLPLDFW